MRSLRDERLAVASAIEAAGAIPVWFEEFGGRDSDPEAAYIAEVESSSVYVGILGREYGRIQKSRFSATHEEYLAAERAGLRISVWAVADGEWDGHQERFVNEVRTFHVTGSFRDAQDLASKIVRRLQAIAAEEISPWCKLGNLIFRAKEIVIAGSQLRVTTLVRDGRVADALEAFRPRAWQGPDLQFTDPSRSVQVRVRDVQSTMTSARSREIQLTADLVKASSSMWMDSSLSMGGRTFMPNDLTEFALREHLFGEANPAGTGWTSLPNPLASFPSNISEEALRPILKLFFVEAMLGSGRASRLVTLRLGVEVDGKRSILLEWDGAQAYSRPAERRSVEGKIEL
jgi:hypothetical protein